MANNALWINTDSGKLQYKFGGSIFTIGGTSSGSSLTFVKSLVNNSGVVSLVNDSTITAGNYVYGVVGGRYQYFPTPGITGLTTNFIPIASSATTVTNSTISAFGGGYKFVTGSGSAYATIIGNGNNNYFRGAVNILNDSSGFTNIGASTGQQNSAIFQTNGSANISGQLYIQSGTTTLGRFVGSGSTFFIDAFASGEGIDFRTNGFANLSLQLLSAGTAQFFTPVAGAASINLPAGTAVTSPNSGDLYHTTGHLYFRDQSTTYDLLASAGTTNFQQALTNGSTLTGTNNVTNTGQTFTWTNAGTGLWKWSGNSQDTTSTTGVNVIASDSSQRMVPWAKFAVKLADYLPSFTIKTHNGLYASGGDSVGLGTNPLDQNTTIANAGFNFYITGTGQTDIGGTSAPAGTVLTVEGNTMYVPSSGNHGMLLNTNLGATNTDGTTSGTSGFNAITYSFNPNTLAATNVVTYPVAATVFINTPPIAGTNVTITNPYALYVNSGASFFNGNVTATTGSTGTFTHILGNNSSGTPPTIAAGSGAGTSPTVAIQGTDMDGLISVTTGTTPGLSATVATITYGYAFPTHSYVVLYPANAITAALGTNMVYATGTTTNFTFTSSVAGLTGSTAYAWYYHVGGY
jgi:hypothetical protein